MKKITPCLWFNNQAEEAVKFYTSIFSNSKVGNITYYGKEGYETHGMKSGTVLTIEFKLNGQTFTVLNGGPEFKFNEAVSFQVPCQTQKEVDYYWRKLSEGGDKRAQQCGWLKDKYSVSWQIFPTILPKLLQDKNTGKSERVMKAMLQMKKIEINKLEEVTHEIR